MNAAAMKKWLKEYGPYLAAVLAIALPWLARPGYLFFTDMSWGPNLHYDWRDNSFLLKLAVRCLAVIFPVDLIEKSYISAALLAVVLGGKRLAERFLEDKRLVFAVSLFALFNPFVYDRMGYGQVGIVAALGFLFLAVGDLLEYPDQGAGRAVRAGLWAGLAVQFSPHFVFFFGAFAALSLALVLLGRDPRTLRRALGHFSFMALIIVALNLNWIAASFGEVGEVGRSISAGIQRQDLAAFQTSGASGADALRNVLMLSGFWGKDQLRYLDLGAAMPGWGRGFLVLLPLIIWGVVAGWRERRTRRLTAGLLAVFAGAVILAVGIRVPVASELTYWLFDHLPLYKGMRETQKWTAVIAAVYALFLALGARQLFRLKIIQANRSVSALFLAGVMIMQAPLLLFGLAGQVSPRPFPADWAEIDQRLAGESRCQGSVLFLPWHMYMSFGWAGGIIAAPAKEYFRCPVIQGTNMEWKGIYDNSGDPRSEAIQDWLSRRGATDLLRSGSLDIRYVLLAKEADWRIYSWLDGLTELRSVSETENLRLYEVIKTIE